MAKAKAKAKDKAVPPYIRARSRGRYGTLINRIEEAFREENPGKEVYWVFDPPQEQTMSQVLSKELIGYELVDGDEEYLREIIPNAGSKVRIGDLTLMSINKEAREQILEQKAMIAEEATQRNEAAFEAEIRKEGGVRKLVTPHGNIRDKEEILQAPDLEGEE